jgi:hypothetical protein
LVLWPEPENARASSRHGCFSQKPAEPAGLGPATLAVVVTIVAPPAPTIVVVARAVVVVVDGVPDVVVTPDRALDRPRRGPDSVPVSLQLRRRI